MHELSIAMSIAEMAQEEAQRRGAAQVNSVHLKLGALSGVVAEALRSSYEIAVHGTPLEGSCLLIEDAPVTAYCATCCAPQQLASIQDFSCPQCGGPTAQIVSGKEIEVIALEITQ